MIALPLKLRRGRRDEWLDANGKAVDAWEVLNLVRDLSQRVADHEAREAKWLATTQQDKPPAAMNAPSQESK